MSAEIDLKAQILHRTAFSYRSILASKSSAMFGRLPDIIHFGHCTGLAERQEASMLHDDSARLNRRSFKDIFSALQCFFVREPCFDCVMFCTLSLQP